MSVPQPADLIDPVRAIHIAIRDAVVEACHSQEPTELAAIEGIAGGDTIYAIDRVSEAVLIELVDSQLATDCGILLIAEGLPDGQVVLPAGRRLADCQLVLIVDPIDGTRGLMYQKRPAWILTGIARYHGRPPRLSDIEAAVQTEIPLVKQHRCDQLWARRGGGLEACRHNLLTGEAEPLQLRPSVATTPANGFAMVSRFFPGGRTTLAAIDDELLGEVLGPVQPGTAACFEDQYIATGGQFAELIAGHDRFIADLRPLLPGTDSPGLVCHPYDVCTALLLAEAGIPITAPDGSPLDAPLDTESPVAWVAYANPTLRQRMEPALQQALRRHGLL